MNLILSMMAVAAAVVGSGMAFPQARRLFNTRQVEGVSAVWIGVSIALNGWWLAYGVTQALWILVPVSGLSLLLYLSIAVLFVHSSGWSSLSPMFTSGVALGALPLVFLVFGGWALAGVVVGLCYGLQLLPAVVAAFRSDEPAGIAPGTWIIALVESVLWLVYGLGVADAALIAGGTSGVVAASLILVRLHMVRTNAIDRAVDTSGTVIRVAPAR
jgi:uncharacterized protein with PQ loop repeat